MMNRAYTVIVCLTLFSSFELSSASAQVYTLPIGETENLGAAPNGATFGSLFFGRRSYCASTFAPTGTGLLPGIGGKENFTGVADQTSIRRIFDGQQQICWHEDPTSTASAVRRLEIFQLGMALPISARIDETTLVGGFNTVVTNFNFLELSATARFASVNENIEGQVILKRTLQGGTVILPFSFDFSTSVQVRQDISIHDLIGNAQDFGQVVVIHNAPPGLLKARVSQYRILTVAPLDFEPVAQEVLVPRVQ